MTGVEYTIRPARLDDRSAIERLIAASARGLSRDDYTDEQIETALQTIFGVDTELILDGTYFVAEAGDDLIACGGWSKRRTLFGGDRYARRETGELKPATEPAKIRAFFVHPSWVRRGLARAILDRCESEARAHGFRALELMATLPGIKFYAASGYKETERVSFEADGVSLEFMPMRKDLD